MKYLLLSMTFLGFGIQIINAQNNIGIGTITPNPKALLDLTANDKGFLAPRLSTAQRLAIAPANIDEALMVFDTDLKLYHYWDGTQWLPFPGSGSNNISLTYDATTGTLSLTDNGGTLTANLPIDNDSDPTNELQNLLLNNNQLEISITNSSVDLSPYLDNTDNQTLSLNGNTLSISNGNSINLPPDNDSDPTNELNTSLTFNNNVLSLTDAGGTLTANLDGLLQTIAVTSPATNTDVTYTLSPAGNTVTANDGDWQFNGNDLYNLNTANVGIGITTPLAKLHVVGTSQNTLAIESPTYPELTFRQSGTIRSYDAITTVAGGYFATSGLNDRIYRTEGTNHLFGSSSTELVRITPAGRVGIGTSAPAGKIDVDGAGSNLFYIGRTDLNARIISCDGNILAFKPPIDGNNVEIQDGNTSNALRIEVSSQINLRAFTPAAGTGSFFFYTDLAFPGAAYVFHGNGNAEVMRMQADGGIGMGVLPFGYRLQLPNIASAAGAGIAFGWATYSDKRLKTNQATMPSVLEKVMSLKPQYFDWLKSEHDAEGNLKISNQKQEKRDFGFMAQELYEVFPEVVFKPENENKTTWAVDYAKLTVVLTKALQEQQQKINELQQKINVLALEK